MNTSSPRQRRKLFDQYTAEEVHQKYAFPIDAKCAGCGRRPLIRAIVMMELKEARKNPLIDELMLLSPQDFMKGVVQIKQADGRLEPYYRLSVTYACKSCRKAMIKQLAKAPSHCIVEVNEGPGPDKLVTC